MLSGVSAHGRSRPGICGGRDRDRLYPVSFYGKPARGEALFCAVSDGEKNGDLAVPRCVGAVSHGMEIFEENH